jgi:hypothetical protein
MCIHMRVQPIHRAQYIDSSVCGVWKIETDEQKNHLIYSLTFSSGLFSFFGSSTNVEQ